MKGGIGLRRKISAFECCNFVNLYALYVLQYESFLKIFSLQTQQLEVILVAIISAFFFANTPFKEIGSLPQPTSSDSPIPISLQYNAVDCRYSNYRVLLDHQFKGLHQHIAKIQVLKHLNVKTHFLYILQKVKKNIIEIIFFYQR